MLLKWFSTGPYPAMGEELFLLAVGKALSFWSACCNLQFERTSVVKEGQIFLLHGPIYPMRPELACMSGTARKWPLSLLFYVNKRWVIARNPEPGKIDAVRVIAHEIGHAILGNDHLSDGTLMARSYNLMARTPQEADIRKAIEIYGPPQEDVVGDQTKVAI